MGDEAFRFDARLVAKKDEITLKSDLEISPEIKEIIHEAIVQKGKEMNQNFYHKEAELHLKMQEKEKKKEELKLKSENYRQELNEQAKALDIKKDQDLISADNVLLAAKKEATEKMEQEKIRAHVVLETAKDQCPSWLKWICFPALVSADLIYREMINVAEFVMSEAMDAANLVYEDSKVNIFDVHERGMKLAYNAYQMKLDAE